MTLSDDAHRAQPVRVLSDAPRSAAIADSSCPVWPEFRDAMWRLRADLARTRQSPHALFFAGVERGVGTTTAAWHFGVAAVELGRSPTLLIDADLSGRVLSERLGARAAPGLAEWAPGQPLPLVDTPIDNLKLLPAGQREDVSIAVLSALGRLGALVEHARNQFGDIVFDGRPLGTSGDAKAIIPAVNGVVLVAESDRTSIARVALATEQVLSAGGTVDAVLRNRAARYTVAGLGFGA
jgi:MinD-like ATPase involved in chromosome partitioning or flagellar assembly